MDKPLKLYRIVIVFLAFLIGFSAGYSKPPKIITKTVYMPQSVETVVEETARAAPQSLGIFKLTAYCPCKACSGKWGSLTATGVTAQPHHTIAIDPKVIPYGTTVVINGNKYIAEDCGGAIKGNRIDIFFESHEDAEQFGVQECEVFLQ